MEIQSNQQNPFVEKGSERIRAIVSRETTAVVSSKTINDMMLLIDHTSLQSYLSQDRWVQHQIPESN